MSRATLLLVDDELIVRRLLGDALARAGYHVEVASSDTEALDRLAQPGTDGVDLLGVPVKLSRTPGAPAGPGPALGEHTRSVLESVGYSAEEVDALLESGAAAEAAGEARGSFLS